MIKINALFCKTATTLGQKNGCMYVSINIYLGLTNIKFCLLYVRMNHCEVHQMITSKAIYFKVQDGNLVGSPPNKKAKHWLM